MKYLSDFTADLLLGKGYETLLGQIFTQKKVEVKADFGARKTGNVFVEYKYILKIRLQNLPYFCLSVKIFMRMFFFSFQMFRKFFWHT